MTEIQELRLRIAGLEAERDELRLAAAELEESREKFELITGNIHEVIFMFSPDWHEAIYVSPAYETVWGRPVRDVYRDPRSWMEAIMPEDMGRMVAFIDGQARGEVAHENDIEFRIRTPDGAVRWISGRTYPVRDELGRVCRVAGVAEDVTARINAEQRLQDSEKFLNNIFDCFQDGISILDRDLNIIRVNHVMEKWHPYMMPLCGKKCYYVYHERSAPCEKCPSIRAIEQKTAQREIVPLHGRHEELRGWLELFAFPLTDDDGRVIGVIEHVRDITDRKRAEDALRESEDKYRGLVEEISDIVWELDDRGRFNYVSPRIYDILGFRPEEMIGKRPFDLMMPEEVEKAEKDYAVYLDNAEQIDNLIFAHRHRNGQIKYLEITAKPLIDQDGGVRGFRGVTRDINGRMRAEEALRDSERKFRSLVENVNDLVWQVDENCVYTYSSPMIRDMLGYEPGETIGKTLFDFMSAEEAERVSRIVSSIFDERRPFELLENTLTRKDGSTVVMETSGMPMFDDDGAFVGYMGVNRDVSERKRVEKSLKLTQFTMDRTGDMVFWVAPDGRIIYVNQSACKTFGYAREEMLALTAFDTNPVFDDKSWREHWDEIKKRGTYAFEARLRRKDGSFFPAEISANFLVYEGKEYNCSFVRDITERKRAEEALQFERSQLLSIFDSIDEVIYVADPYTYEILYANKAMQDKFGKHLAGGICYREIQDLDAPCDFCTNSIILKEKGRPYRWEYHNPTVGRDFLIYDRMIKWPDGRDVRFELAIDITDRKHAEEAMKEGEEKFRVLAETTRAGIMLYRGEKVVYVNNALEKILGYGRDELMAMNYWDLAHPEHREMMRSRGLARQRDQPVPSTYELKIRTKGGETRWVELSAAIISYKGKQTGLATVFDITDRKRFEEALQDAKAQAELYLDLMGHDINNLNQIGIGFLELALGTLKLDRESRELVARPLEALVASSRLIANVRKLQKLKEGGLNIHEINLEELIRDILPRYADVTDREVRIGCSAGCDCKVSANDLLDDVFANIIHNAIKHSSGPLAIDVHLSNARAGDRKYCLVAIEDDGPGIPDDLKSRIFSRFERGNSKADGRGLGLYLVRMLVEDFHGRVWVEDRVPGDHTRGTRFMIMLPSAAE